MGRPEAPPTGNQELSSLPASAAGGQASLPELVLQPAPALRDPMAWVDRLAIEGTQRIEALQASAAASIAHIRAQADGAAQDASSAFTVARGRFEATAQTAFVQIESFRANAIQRISAEIATQATELDTRFAASAENAHGSAQEATTRITQTAEREAKRSVSESAARAARARGLVQSGDTGGETPLANGQREIAGRVSEEMAQQCLLTGQDAAAEVHKARASRITGIDAFLRRVLQTLEGARNAAHGKLARSEVEATVCVTEQATRITEEVEVRRAEGLTGLDQQESSLTSWLREQAEEQCAQVSARAEEGVATLNANLESINERFNEVAHEFGPVFADASTGEFNVGAMQVAFSEEMTRVWTEQVAPQLAEGDRIAASFDEHASGVEQGLRRVSSDALSTLEQTISSTTEGLTTLADRFGRFVETASERAVSAVRNGIAGACAEADRAVAVHTTAVTNEASQAEQAIHTAVNDQLAWEDQQVDRANEEILAGQSQAAQRYRDLEEQARARDEGEASTAIARGWLGDLWSWFSDLAESTLEWFQEKLGRVWGNIIGHILRSIIYVVGVVVCGVAWLGAQVINLVWGFIWGETAIPGYGGGFFNFVGDIIAGILVVGDIRDLFKYGLWRPFITGEGPWWLNLGMFILTVLFLIPFYGDIGKIIVKALKGGGKGALRLLARVFGEEFVERILRRFGIDLAQEFAERLAREVGAELAERMIRELGEEGAEELLERLGKDTIQQLAEEVSPTVIRDLADELGERTLQRLAAGLGGSTIQTLSNDLGREAIEKLLRTVGPEVVEELHRRLGPDVVRNLLEGLRGVTIREYLGELGETALQRLGRDLDGYAVKELFDDLGATTLRRLATDLTGETVQRLANDLGTDLLRDLAQEFAPRTIREIVDDVSAATVRELAEVFGATALKQLHDDLGRALFREYTSTFSARSLKRLIDRIGGQAARELAEAMGVREVRTLVRKFGYVGLAELVNEIGVQGISDLGMRALKMLAGDPGLRLSARQISEWIADLGMPQFRQLAETYGGMALRHYGRAWFKAYKGVTAQTRHHLLVGEFNALGHLRSGCHDKTAFDGVVAAGNAVIDAAQTRVSGIYTEYWWRRPNQAVGNLGPKTVVDNLAANWVAWADRIRRATDQLIRQRRFPANPGAIPRATIEGTSWRGYFRNDEIATFFPEI
jgi:hypothetical protein